MKKVTFDRIRENSLSRVSLLFGFPGPGITVIGQYSYFFDLRDGCFYRCKTCLRDIEYLDSDGRVCSHWVAIAGGVD